MQATIQKWGNSNAVRIPKPLLDDYALAESDKVELKLLPEGILITKSTRRPRATVSLDELFKDYTGDYLPEEYDWGKPVGREVW